MCIHSFKRGSRRTSYRFRVRGLDFGEDDFGREGSEGDHAEYHCVGESLRPEAGHGRTFVVKNAIPVAHPSLSSLCYVEYADTEADVVEDAIRIFFVEL